MKKKNGFVLLAMLLALSSCTLSPSFLNGKDGTDGANGINGVDGVNGYNGKDGVDGSNGKNGTDGTNGQDGADGKRASSILSGSIAPTSDLGEDGDTYFDIATGNLYIKESGAWTLIYNNRGTDGSKGDTGADGDDGQDGAIGDSAYTSFIVAPVNGLIYPSKASAIVGEEVTFYFVPRGANTKVAEIQILDSDGTNVSTVTSGTGTVESTVAMRQFGFVVSATFTE